MEKRNEIKRWKRDEIESALKWVGEEETSFGEMIKKGVGEMKKVYILGSRNRERIGEIGIAIRGNPVKYEDKEKLNEFSNLYWVRKFWYSGYRYFKVVGVYDKEEGE